MVQPLDGIRVVEFSDGMAGPMAGALLADYGAEVVKVEPKGGDWARGYPGFLTWNRGKRSIALDLRSPGGRFSAQRLAKSADVLLESFRPGEESERGLGFDELSSANPSLIYCSISGFGMGGTYEQLFPYEGVVAAKSGRYMDNGPMAGSDSNADGPIYVSAPIGSYGAATLAVQGIAAALIDRLRSGVGQRVSTSLLDGLSAATMRLAFERRGDEVIPVRRQPGGPNLTHTGIRISFMTAQCKDGRYIQMCARQPQHFQNWLRALGLEDLGREQRFSALPFGLRSIADAEEIESAIRSAMLTKTQAEWMDIFVNSTDVGGDPFLTPAEFLRHPQMVENDRVVVLEDPIHGSVTEVGRLVAFDQTPAVIESPAPTLGDSNADLPEILERWETASLDGSARPAPESGPSQTPPGHAPLEGFTVLELATFLAAPLGPTLLAELGARVIKLEPLEGDPFRRVGLEFVHIGHGKESIAVDLKTAEGKEIFGRLVGISDAMIHNFRPGVAERLGAGYEDARKINPDILYLYGASYGSKGPQRHRAAFHSTPNALCGGGILQAGVGNPPVDDSYPDPCGGLGAATALALGLLARARFGVGQFAETTMLCSTGWVHSDRLTLYDGEPSLPMVDHQQTGLHALYRLYPCRSGWTFLAAVQEGEWLQLTSCLQRADLARDGRFSTEAARATHDDELRSVLEAIFVTDDAPVWEKLLSDSGVSAVAVGDYSFEEFLVNEGLVSSDEHQEFGTYWRLPPRIRFSRSANRLAPPSAIGEHTVALLREVGYGEEDIAHLIDLKVVVASGSGSAFDHERGRSGE